MSARRLVRILPSLSALVLAAACSTEPTVRRDELDEAFFESVCEVLEDCVDQNVFDDGGFLRAMLLSSETTTCEAILEASTITFEEEAIVASIEAGRIVYDAGDARACLDAIGRSCSLTAINARDALDPRCRTMLEGTVAVGASCTLDEDCAGDARCDKASDDACTGSCVARVPVGEPCDGDVDCTHEVESGFAVCDDSAGNMVRHCVATTITIDVGEGEACGTFGGDSDARSIAVCRSDLYCRQAAGSAGTCQTPLAVSVPCTPSLDTCAGTAFCFAADGVNPVCTEIAVQTEDGAPCGAESLALCNELDRLTCGDDGLCHRLGTGALGQPCQDSNFASFCNAGLYCDTSLEQAACAEVKPDGAVCTGDAQCSSGNCEAAVPVSVCAQASCI